MLRMEMSLNAAAPSSHKRKIQRSTDCRAGQGNQAACPLLHRFGANLGGKTFCDARGQFLEKLLFSQVFTVIDTGGSGSSLPHFDPLVVAVSFESVEQRKTLDEPQGDNREQAGIRQKCDDASEADARAFRKRQALGVTNQR